MRRSGSARHPPNRLDQLLDLVPLLDRIAGDERTGDAVRHVIAQDLLLHLVQGRAHGIDLVSTSTQ